MQWSLLHWTQITQLIYIPGGVSVGEGEIIGIGIGISIEEGEGEGEGEGKLEGEGEEEEGGGEISSVCSGEESYVKDDLSNIYSHDGMCGAHAMVLTSKTSLLL